MDTVERYSRPARWFHAAVYLLVLVLLAGGWWFVIDRYQHPIGPDTLIHEAAGLLLIVITALYCVTRARAVRAFLRESTIVPGYRGVWRSMHLGGKLPTTVASRIWPGWTSRYVDRS